MTNLEILFDDLATARARYEDLRVSGASFSERVNARTALHELRARIGAARRGEATV